MGVDRPRDPPRPQGDFAYGGDFGEPLHDGNFVADGLVLPDRTPSPGLLELKAVFAPVRIGAGGIANLHVFRDLVAPAFAWALEVEGEAVAEGDARSRPGGAGRDGPAAVAGAPAAPEGREAWLTVRALLAAGRAVGARGPRGRVRPAAGRGAPRRARRPRAPPAAPRRRAIALGAGAFDAATGRLVRLGALELDGPRLDVWRAPIDNDVGTHGPEQLADAWRAAGLHRMVERVLGVELGRRRRSSCACASRRPARTAACSRASRWTAEGDALACPVAVEPEGEWPFPLPRLGTRHGAAGRARAGSSGSALGPGEAYADSRAAVRVGRFALAVDELQTHYVMPQENGNRAAGALGGAHRRRRRAGCGSRAARTSS